MRFRMKLACLLQGRFRFMIRGLVGLLHAGGEGVHFRLVNVEGILKHDARQWWVGGKESHSQLRHHCIADMRRYERGVGTVCVIRESVYIVWIELLHLHYYI